MSGVQQVMGRVVQSGVRCQIMQGVQSYHIFGGHFFPFTMFPSVVRLASCHPPAHSTTGGGRGIRDGKTYVILGQWGMLASTPVLSPQEAVLSSLHLVLAYEWLSKTSQLWTLVTGSTLVQKQKLQPSPASLRNKSDSL